MSPRRFPLPPQARLARWAVKYGPLLLPYAKRAYEQGRFRQLAILHARTLTDGTFSWEMVDGERVWVVWGGDDVVATYPDRPDLVGGDGMPFPGARPDRRRDPDDVTVQRARRRLAGLSLPGRRGRGGADTGEDEYGLIDAAADTQVAPVQSELDARVEDAEPAADDEERLPPDAAAAPPDPPPPPPPPDPVA